MQNINVSPFSFLDASKTADRIATALDAAENAAAFTRKFTKYAGSVVVGASRCNMRNEDAIRAAFEAAAQPCNV